MMSRTSMPWTSGVTLTSDFREERIRQRMYGAMLFAIV
jgi:hypothetical protein